MIRFTTLKFRQWIIVIIIIIILFVSKIILVNTMRCEMFGV